MAFNKVVISGINTSELTILKEEEKMRLLREIRDTGSKIARDELIKGNLRLVLSVIQKFTGRGEDIDDLFQIGVVGLIKAKHRLINFNVFRLNIKNSECLTSSR